MATTHNFAACTMIDSTTLRVPGLINIDIDSDDTIDLYVWAKMDAVS